MSKVTQVVEESPQKENSRSRDDSLDSLVESMNQSSVSIDSSHSNSKVFNVTERVRLEVFRSLPPNDAIVVPTALTLEDLLVNVSNSFNNGTSRVLVVPTNLLSSEDKKAVPISQSIDSLSGHCLQLAKDQPTTSIVDVLQFYTLSDCLYIQLYKVFGKLTGTRVRSQSHTTHDYYKKALSDIDAVGYKAAGLVLYRKNQDKEEYEFLLGEAKHELTTLGGKIDKVDQNVYDTAVREFNEETSLLLESQHIERIRAYLKDRGEGSRVMWYSGGKYALCFLSVDDVPGLYAATESLPQRMEELRGDEERWGRLPSSCREMDGLRWISTSDFKALENKQLSKFLSRMKTSIGFEAWLGSLKGSVEYPKFAERFRSNTV